MNYQAGLPFDNPAVLPRQILPGDGDCRYFGRIFSPEEALQLFQGLLKKIPWKRDEVMVYGRHYLTVRQVAWFGESQLSYTYSGTTHSQPLPWSRDLVKIKNEVEARTGQKYNACLANLYQDGSQGMGWHQDNEEELSQSSIASVSLGAERRFDFRHKQTGEKLSIFLEQGSLLLMAGQTQKHWQHQLPRSAKVVIPRINLTFRNIIGH